MSTRTTVSELFDDLLERDTLLIVTVLAALYAAYLLVGLVLGYSQSGLLNTLVRLTFLIAVYSIVVLGLNLHWGYTGLFNIGVAGFMAIGLYVTAILAKPVNPTGAAQYGGFGLPVPVAILLGTLAAALAGLLVALPALRLRADYLAITTVAFSEIVRLTLTSSTFAEFSLLGYDVGTGGGRGLIFNYADPMDVIYGTGVFDALASALDSTVGFQRTQTEQLVYVLVLACVVASVYWVIQRAGKSPFGRVLKAIREDEEAATALGKRTSSFKIKSFMLGCALMGLAGILWYYRSVSITPTEFRPNRTFYIWIALIIGGAGSNTGSVLGAGLFVGLLFEGPLYLRRVIEEVFTVGDAPATIAGALGPMASLEFFPFVRYVFGNILELQFVLMGVVLILLMQRRPDGLLGHREEVAAAISLDRPDDHDPGDGNFAVSGEPTPDGGQPMDSARDESGEHDHNESTGADGDEQASGGEKA
jgi:branched-chain amino acid transport system permease protein